MSFTPEWFEYQHLSFQQRVFDLPSKEEDWLAFSPTKCLGAVVCLNHDDGAVFINIYYGPFNTPSKLIKSLFPQYLPNKILFKTEFVLEARSDTHVTETFDLAPTVLPYVVFES